MVPFCGYGTVSRRGMVLIQGRAATSLITVVRKSLWLSISALREDWHAIRSVMVDRNTRDEAGVGQI